MRRLGKRTELISVKKIIPCAILKQRFIMKQSTEDFLKLNDIHGEIFTPIIVQPCSACSVEPGCEHRGEDLFGEVSGFRRLQKVLESGEETIECYLASFENLEDMLLTNYRSDEERLEYNLYDKGARMSNMLKQLSSDKKRLSYRQLADILHCNKGVISKLLQMFKLAEENKRYKKALLMRIFTFNEAYDFIKLKQEEQEKVLDKIFSEIEEIVIDFGEEPGEEPSKKLSKEEMTKEAIKKVRKIRRKNIDWLYEKLRLKAGYVKPICPHCGKEIRENKELVDFYRKECKKWEPLRKGVKK